MLPSIDIVKGIHPGLILERELKKRNIKKTLLSNKIKVSPGIITDITKQRRGISAALSVMLGKFFNFDESYFALLQAYFEIKTEKFKMTKVKLDGIRPILFWDIKFDNLDFDKHKGFIVKRIFERGNGDEINKIIAFYGKEEIIKILNNCNNILFTAIENIDNYLGTNKDEIKWLQTYTQKPSQKPYIQH
jgi:antitoxin HigA-1